MVLQDRTEPTRALARIGWPRRQQNQRLGGAGHEHAWIGIVEVDAEGRLLRVDAQFCALMQRSPEELLGRSIFQETFAEDVEPDQQQFRRQVTGEIDRYVVEGRLKRRDGGYFWASVTSSAVRDAEGRFLYAVRVQQDISEPKRSERTALQLASIVENSDDAIISTDICGTITTWNAGAECLLGYKAEEIIGQPVTILIPDDRPNEELGILARIRNGERVFHYETVRRRKDGSRVDISLTVSPMRDSRGRIVGASKIARDITERKEAEAKLRDNERRLREILAAIPAAIYTTDAHGRITYFNQAAVELAGRTPVLGSDEWCASWTLYQPDGTPMRYDECPMAIALNEGRPIRNAEAIAERPDGRRVPFIPYSTPLFDANGKVVGAINMLVDISERRQAEAQQRVLFNELNHRVKNNMQTLQSLLHLAAQQTRSAEAREVLAEAGGRVAAMAAAQSVLYETTNAAQFSVREFLNSVCKTVQQSCAADVSIVCEAASGELSNEIAMPLALILNELLTNAVKHGINGGERSIIRVGLTQENESRLLYVEDDGPGFEVEQTRDRSSGLQLVQGLARQLRGQFDVARNPSRCTLQF